MSEVQCCRSAPDPLTDWPASPLLSTLPPSDRPPFLPFTVFPEGISGPFGGELGSLWNLDAEDTMCEIKSGKKLKCAMARGVHMEAGKCASKLVCASAARGPSIYASTLWTLWGFFVLQITTLLLMLIWPLAHEIDAKITCSNNHLHNCIEMHTVRAK